MSVYELYWEIAADGGARLLRIFGMTPEAVLPEQIEGHPLTEIGDYCFAEREHLRENYRRIRIKCEEPEAPSDEYTWNTGLCGDSDGRDTPAELHELSGGYIERVILPDTVEKVGNFAFYNASSLTCLEIGGKLIGIGSDAFMNCRKLHRLCLRCRRGEASGLRQILAQISHDMEVSFRDEGGIWAKVLFPEYYESYDEIAPAHIFGRNIEGEGFRARQSFRDGAMDFAQYDLIFPKACVEEKEETLCRLACNRLRYPVMLGQEAKRLYTEYLTAHTAALCAMAVRARDMELAAFFCRQQIFARADIECCIGFASETEWVEGSAYFMRLLEEFFPRKTVASRYKFDDF